MLRVPLTSARPGMILALPIYHPKRHDTALLAGGVVLDHRSIRRLREIHLAEVWVKYPSLAFIGEYVSPEIVAAHADLAHTVTGAFDRLAAEAHARLDYRSYRRAVASLLDSILSSPKAGIFIQEMIDRDRPALRHAINVCFLSLLMGLKLEDYLIIQRSRLASAAARDVTSLGLGALLHDIGMLRLEPEVISRWAKTGDASDPRWREHVHLGFRMVQGKVGPSAAAAVLHHHQAWDGSGFPRRRMLDGALRSIAGDEIHVFARIVGAADAFDRARHPVESEAPIPTVRALKQLRDRDVGIRLDPMTFKALLAVAPAYPPGSVVTLSTGLRAVVTEWFPEDPCRPTVHAGDDLESGFTDAGAKLRRIALREHPSVSIVEIDGFDVSRDNFHAAKPDEFDLRLAGRALFNRAEPDDPARRAG